MMYAAVHNTLQAHVNKHTGTPINATLLTSATAGALALMFDINLLAELVSIGTLVVFFLVCAGVLHHRYHIHGSGANAAPVIWRMVAVGFSSIGFSVSYTEYAPWPVPVLFLGK